MLNSKVELEKLPFALYELLLFGTGQCKKIDAMSFFGFNVYDEWEGFESLFGPNIC